MKGYNKKQGIKLQRKVLSSLFIAGAAYVCILGGDNAAWASDYTSTDTLSTSSYGETYDKIAITMVAPEKTAPVFILMAEIIRQQLMNG